MAVEVTLSNLTPSTVPADGWIVGYRILGSVGSYTIPSGSPFTALPIVFTTSDPVGTLYEGYITRDCGTLSSTQFFWQTPCDCTGAGYVESPSGLECELNESTAPTITNSGYCLAPSPRFDDYSEFGSRIYNTGATASDLLIPSGTVGGIISHDMQTAPQWRQFPFSTSNGPMNRNAVWIDSDCDGLKNGLGDYISSLTNLVGGTGYVDGTYNNVPLTGGSPNDPATATIIVSGGAVTSVTLSQLGNGYVVTDVLSASNTDLGGSGSGFSIEVDTVSPQQTTIAYLYDNPGPSKTIYVGLAGDNQFTLIVNGTVIIDSTPNGIQGNHFQIFHIFPITVVTGPNYINLVGVGAGVQEALAMVIYDNTAAEIAAATDDSQLDILFQTQSLFGESFDIATCPATYSLDTSEGSGNYICRKTTYKNCNTLL
jgi:hypothetical protein